MFIIDFLFSYLIDSILPAVIISFAFTTGFSVAIIALKHRQYLAFTLRKVIEYAGLRPEIKTKQIDCDVCGAVKCNRHLSTPNREPWRGLFIIKELDDALASVSSAILFYVEIIFYNYYCFLALHQDTECIR